MTGRVWLPSSPCGDGCLPSADAASTATPWRQAVRHIAMAMMVAAGAIIGIAAPAMGPRLRRRAVRAWSRGLLTAVGARLVVTGTDRLTAAGPVGTLVVANHISWLDGIALLAVEPVGVLVKHEVRRWPVIGALVRRLGGRYIDRARLRQLPTVVAELAASLRAGESTLVFPEATTWCGIASSRFRPATFQAALDAGAAVRPVSIGYRLADGTTTTAPAFLGDESLWTSLRRTVAIHGLTVTVCPHETVPAVGGRCRLAHAAQTAVTRDTLPPYPISEDRVTRRREYSHA